MSPFKPAALLGLALATSLPAASARLALGLAQAEAQALQRDPSLAAAQASLQAAQATARASWAPLLPKLSLDAFWQRAEVVPTMRLSPLAPAINLSQNESYSYGPSATWTLWDSGQTWLSAGAENARARARQAEWRAASRELRMRVRQAYAQAQLAQAQERLLFDGVALAMRQWQELSASRSAGGASPLDELQAHQALLERQRQRRQAQADLAQALRDLLTLTQGKPGEDGLLAAGEEDPSATLVSMLDPLDSTLESLRPLSSRHLDTNPPRAESFAELAEASRKASQALWASVLPKVSAYGRSGYDWPNGPAPEAIHQTVYGVKGSWALFSGGAVMQGAAAQRAQARSLDEQGQALREQAARDWAKCQDRWHGLQDQAALAAQAAEMAQQAAGMTERSWKAGRNTFTDVLSANLKSLEAATTLARIRAQSEVELALIDALSAD